ncbi:MAG: flagellar basal body L-ring protein FlgH [Steroidobacteraceae bacterium]
MGNNVIKLAKQLSTLAAALAAALILAALPGCGLRPHPDDNYAAALPEEVPIEVPPNGAIFHTGHDVPLFRNTVAHRVGDVLTITLEEQTNASKSATTTTKKTTTEAMAAPTLLGAPLTIHGKNILNNNLNDATTFDGEGTSAQSNVLTGSISVTVAKRLANGNLLVRGEKWLTINQGREFVRISGIVRPVDIQPDNSVPSTQVADAVIAYAGQGTLADANTKGWLARFFDSKWMPF